MRLNRVDLNLLLVIDALLTDGKVSKAAVRLNVTQPAISNALARLRQHFDDPLFLQVGREMVPTELTQRLSGPIRQVLDQSRIILEARASFDPASAVRRFSVSVSDYEGNVFMPKLARRLAEVAPKVSLALRQTVLPADLDEPHVADLLERRGNDCVLLPESMASPSYMQEWLYDEDSVCVAWVGNTRLGEQLRLEDLTSLPHVVAEFADNRSPALYVAPLHQLGHEIHAAVTVEQFSLIPQYVIGTERIAILQANLARQLAEYYPLKLFTVPLELPPLRVVMQWMQQRASDPGLRWFLDQIRSLARTIDSVTVPGIERT